MPPELLVDDLQDTALAAIAGEIRDASWSLALQVVNEAVRGQAIPSFERLDRIHQLGDIPTFITEVGRELAYPEPDRLRRGSVLAALVRDHARNRESLGFAPREVLMEFFLLRRVVWDFVSQRSGTLTATDLLLVETRLNALVDHLVTECVVAYFDRATVELAHKARCDALTELLNHQAFTSDVKLELERGRRYGHGAELVFLDLDGFKQINDTLGHPEGDRVLCRVADLLREELRSSDRAGRMGGDEFAALLIESEPGSGEKFLERLYARMDELVLGEELPLGFGISAGAAHFPSEASSTDALFKLADTRLYEAKRRKQLAERAL